jgi:hypothetical protein
VSDLERQSQLEFRALILHNLAVVNWCEIMDHNDKIEEKGANFDGNVNNELLDQFKQIEIKKEKD